MRQRFFRILLVASALGLTGAASLSWAQVDPSGCGDFRSHLQWDYRKATPKEHKEVEGAHFVPKVEQLIGGNRGPLGADLSYTLGASPNHHRALVAITRWSERLKTTNLPYLAFPVECYFVRGMNFAPDDHIVRLLYAQFLILWARPAEAAKQLEYVANMVGEDPFTLYNIGLIYVNMKDYAQALAYAHKAMALGFSRPELREQLERAGQWSEPAAKGLEAPAAASAASALGPSAQKVD